MCRKCNFSTRLPQTIGIWLRGAISEDGRKRKPAGCKKLLRKKPIQEAGVTDTGVCWAQWKREGQHLKAATAPSPPKEHNSCLFRIPGPEMEKCQGQQTGFRGIWLRRHVDKYPGKNQFHTQSCLFLHMLMYNCPHTWIFPTFQGQKYLNWPCWLSSHYNCDLEANRSH